MPPVRVKTPHGIVEFPEGTSPEEMESALSGMDRVSLTPVSAVDMMTGRVGRETNLSDSAPPEQDDPLKGALAHVAHPTSMADVMGLMLPSGIGMTEGAILRGVRGAGRALARGGANVLETVPQARKWVPGSEQVLKGLRYAGKEPMPAGVQPTSLAEQAPEAPKPIVNRFLEWMAKGQQKPGLPTEPLTYDSTPLENTVNRVVDWLSGEKGPVVAPPARDAAYAAEHRVPYTEPTEYAGPKVDVDRYMPNKSGYKAYQDAPPVNNSRVPYTEQTPRAPLAGVRYGEVPMAAHTTDTEAVLRAAREDIERAIAEKTASNSLGSGRVPYAEPHTPTPVEVGRVTGKAPVLEDELRKALEASMSSHDPVELVTSRPSEAGMNVAEGAYKTGRSKTNLGGYDSGNPPRTAEEMLVQDLAEKASPVSAHKVGSRGASGAADAASVSNGAPASTASTSEFPTAEEAASFIQRIAEMRRMKGSRDVGRLLFPNKTPAERQALIRALDPSPSRIPIEAEERIRNAPGGGDPLLSLLLAGVGGAMATSHTRR